MGFYEMLNLTSEKRKSECLFYDSFQDHFTSVLFAALLDKFANPHVRKCLCLKITLFEPQLIYFTRL